MSGMNGKGPIQENDGGLLRTPIRPDMIILTTLFFFLPEWRNRQTQGT